MIKLILNFFVGLLSSLAKAWLVQHEAEDKGKLEAENNAFNIASKAVAVRDSVKPLTTDELQEHTVSNDPDFRD